MKNIYSFLISIILLVVFISQSFSQTEIDYHETFFDTYMNWTEDTVSEDCQAYIDTETGVYALEDYTEKGIVCKAPLKFSTESEFSYSFIVDETAGFISSIGISGKDIKLHFELNLSDAYKYRINYTKSSKYKTGKWKKIQNMPLNNLMGKTSLKIKSNANKFTFFINDSQMSELDLSNVEKPISFDHLEIGSVNSSVYISDLYIKASVVLNEDQFFLTGNGISQKELKNKKIYTVSEAVADPIEVYNLSIDNTWKKEYLPDEITQCRNLQKVYIYGESNFDYSEIIESLANFPQLTTFELDRLDEIPVSIKQLTNLRSLKVIFCQSRQVPEEIGSLYKLKHLDLFRNDFMLFPFKLSNLSQLESLNLSDNDLKAVPEFVFQLTGIDSLDLGYNNLQTINGDIGNLKELKYLNLKFNDLKSLPHNIGELKKLNRFELAWNYNLTHLPKEIGELVSLEVFDMSGCDAGVCNGLKVIPKEMGKLTNLKVLNFGWCHVKTIPEELSNLKNLKFFSIYSDMDELEIKRVKNLLSFVKTLNLN